MRKRWIIGAWGLLIAVGVAACNERQKAAPPTKTPEASASRHKTDTKARPLANEQAESTKSQPTVAPSPPPVPQPLSPKEIEALWMQPDLASDNYGTRLEAVRSIFHRVRHHGQLEEARTALVILLDEVEKQEGQEMAQRVAFSEAGNLEAQKDYRAAVMAYRLLLERYPNGPFAAEAQYHLGGALLELHEYAEAAQVWQGLIEEHDDSPLAPWGWRKLALVQLLQGQFDTSLGTLELMAGKYAGTEFGEYARMRRGYVCVAAGRMPEAKATYETFLTECPHSKYVRLVQQQMADLERARGSGADVLAQVNGRER
jgi:TolA-binding protein